MKKDPLLLPCYKCTAQMFVPLGGWIGHFYMSFSLLSHCITSVGLWTTWSQVKIPHSIHLLGEAACRGLNLPLECCRTSQQ